MNIKKTALLLVCMTVFSIILSAAGNTRKINKIINRRFPEPREVSVQPLTVSDYIGEDESTFTDKPVTLRTIKSGSDSYYSIDGSVKSKSGSISFILFVDKTGTIIDLVILRSPGMYGNRIKNKRWLKKFNGYNSPEQIIPGKTVDSISGATRSVDALTKGVKSSLNILKKVLR